MAEGHFIDKNSILKKIEERTGPPQGIFGCTVWLGGTWNFGRYGFLRNPFFKKSDNQPQRIGVHRLVYILNNLEKYPTGELPQSLECSHLCHNSLCVNKNHIILEPGTVNNERRSCKSQGHCTGSHGSNRPLCLL